MNSATIFTAFLESADAAGNEPALITPHISWTFAELCADSLRLAGNLTQPAAPGPVLVLSDDPKNVLTAVFACAAAGRPALILDPALPNSRLQGLAERYGVPLVALDAKFAGPFSAWDCLDFGQTLQRPPVPLPTVDSEAEFYWGLTSGTTAEPKLFARSHRSWLESFAASEAVFSFPPRSQILIPGPLSHSLFLYGAVHALCRGHAVIAPGSFRPDRAVAAANRATHTYLVPSMLSEMLKYGFRQTRLRMIFSGGAKLSDTLRAQCEAALPDADLAEFYGASETSFISATSTTAPAPNASVGRPFPGVRIEIRNAAGEALPVCSEGDVFVQSRMLFTRYVDGSSCTDWFTAGDIGFLDAQEFLYLTGRKNRVINSRALKIRPETIEEALLQLPSVRHAAVVDLPDGRRGSIAVAAIEFQPGTSMARGALSQHCRTQVGAPMCPQRYYRAEAMPLTPSGKIAFASVREALLGQNPTFHQLI